MRTMIYHQAYPFKPDSVSASAIRPIRMHQAFTDAGYDVITIAGYAKDRRRAIRNLKKRLASGLKVDFLYSEATTFPLMLTEKRHLPPHFFLDRALFALCKRNAIPVGVFYRDIYWVFDEYTRHVGWPLAPIMRAFFRHELSVYKKYCTRLFVPSLAMMDHIPSFPKNLLYELPPGGEIRDLRTPSSPLHLLYVGGIDAHYEVVELVNAVKKLQDIELTLCVAPERWRRVKALYDVSGFPNIHIVHRQSHELDELYGNANLTLIMVKPTNYWEFAVPVKTFEYIGAGKPIIASEGTYIADFIEREQIGWSLPYDSQEISKFLLGLADTPLILEKKTDEVEKLREEHTWVARAHQVGALLSERKESSADS